MSAEDTGLREAVERLVRDLEQPLNGARQRANTVEDFAEIRALENQRCRVARQLRTLLAEHQPTAREGAPERCACGSLTLATTLTDRHDRGLHGADSCIGQQWRVQPAPVAPAGGRLSEEERRHGVEMAPGGFASTRRVWYDEATVERILAARLAAAEQRVTEAKAEALQEAAAFMDSDDYVRPPESERIPEWMWDDAVADCCDHLNERAIGIRRDAIGRGM